MGRLRDSGLGTKVERVGRAETNGVGEGMFVEGERHSKSRAAVHAQLTRFAQIQGGRPLVEQYWSQRSFEQPCSRFEQGQVPD